MRYTLRTRDGETHSFWCPDGGGYVRLESGRNHGSLGRQICEGGKFRGQTLSASPETLPAVARRWWKQRVAHERAA